MRYTLLDDRAVIAVAGEDARSFLQGLISNDIHKVSPTQAIYALVLTPQGKYLHDMFISEQDGTLLLECAAVRLPELLKKLAMYKLRSKVTIEDVSSQYKVVALIGEGAIPVLEGVVYADPRNAQMGFRALMPQAAPLPEGWSLGNAAYEERRMQLAIPEGEKDLLPEKAFPLEYGLEELHAIDFKKGCYVGQEVTARTKYRGVVRKKIYRVEGSSLLPEQGTEITADGTKIGVLCSHKGTEGLALLRGEEYAAAKEAGKALMAGEVIIHVIADRY